MSLGGFLGRDNTVSVAQFADYVSSGAIRYVMVGQSLGGTDGTFRGFSRGAGGVSAPGAASGPTAVLSAVQRSCTAVTDPSLPSAYRAALYDCKGTANAIRQSSS